MRTGWGAGLGAMLTWIVGGAGLVLLRRVGLASETLVWSGLFTLSTALVIGAITRGRFLFLLAPIWTVAAAVVIWEHPNVALGSVLMLSAALSFASFSTHRLVFGTSILGGALLTAATLFGLAAPGLAKNPLAPTVWAALGWSRPLPAQPLQLGSDGLVSVSLPRGWFSGGRGYVQPELDAWLVVKRLTIPGLAAASPAALQAIVAAELGREVEGAQALELGTTWETAFDFKLAPDETADAARLYGLGDIGVLVAGTVPKHRAAAFREQVEAVVNSLSVRVGQHPQLPPELLRQGRASTVFLRTTEGSGSGLAYSVPGGTVVLTNTHVLAQSKADSRVEIFTAEHALLLSITVRDFVRAPEDDLAVLVWPERTTAPPEPAFRSTTELPPHVALFAFGYPWGEALSFDETPDVSVNAGWTLEQSSVRPPVDPAVRARAAADGGVQLKLAEMRSVDLGINPGNSGGPVFDAAGEFVGLATMRSFNGDTAYVVPSERVAAVIEQRAWGSLRFRARRPTTPPPASQPAVPREPPPAEAAARARTALVEVRLGEEAAVPGVVVEKVDGQLIIYVSQSLPADAKVTVSSGGITLGAKVRVSGAPSLLSVADGKLPGVQPLALRDPAGLELGQKVLLVTQGHERWGHLSSLVGAEGQVAFLGADFGRVQDGLGVVLVGDEPVALALHGVAQSNSTFAETRHGVRALLSPQVLDAAWSFRVTRGGECAVHVKVFARRFGADLPRVQVALAIDGEVKRTQLLHEGPGDVVEAELPFVCSPGRVELVSSVPGFDTPWRARLPTPPMLGWQVGGRFEGAPPRPLSDEALTFVFSASPQIVEPESDCEDFSDCTRRCKAGETLACKMNAKLEALDGRPGKLQKENQRDCEAGRLRACLSLVPTGLNHRKFAEQWCAAGLYEACYLTAPNSPFNAAARRSWERNLPPLNSIDCVRWFGHKLCLGGLSFNQQGLTHTSLVEDSFDLGDIGVVSILSDAERERVTRSWTRDVRHLDYLRAIDAVRRKEFPGARQLLMRATERQDPMALLLMPPPPRR